MVWDPELQLQGKVLRCFSVVESLRYLGVDITLAKGFSKKSHVENLKVLAERVWRLALELQHQALLVFPYIVPALAHRLTINPPPVEIVRKLSIKSLEHQ